MMHLRFDRLIAISSIGLGIMTLIQPSRSILGFVAFNPYLMAALLILPSLYLAGRKTTAYSLFLACSVPLLLYFLLFLLAYGQSLLDSTIPAPSLAIAWIFLMFYLLIHYVKSEMQEKGDG